MPRPRRVVVVGAETLEADEPPVGSAIRQSYPRLPVIQLKRPLSRAEPAPEFSELALRPGEGGSALVSGQHIRDDLIPRIKQGFAAVARTDSRITPPAVPSFGDGRPAEAMSRHTPRVEIDFTERKYVRKQRDAAPGMVWYTNARSRVGRPDAVPATPGG